MIVIIIIFKDYLILINFLNLKNYIIFFDILSRWESKIEVISRKCQNFLNKKSRIGTDLEIFDQISPTYNILYKIHQLILICVKILNILYFYLNFIFHYLYIVIFLPTIININNVINICIYY